MRQRAHSPIVSAQIVSSANDAVSVCRMQVMQVVSELGGTPWLRATRRTPRNHLQDRG